uniref:NANOG neighbor homeobox n=1 Tax=Halichoerus grypus TaxID=9711 RepID=UPI00165914E9|nr:NANOG neighbor homeobox [Halichoerus grypus]
MPIIQMSIHAIFQPPKMYSPFLILGPNTEAVYSDKNLVDLDETYVLLKRAKIPVLFTFAEDDFSHVFQGKTRGKVPLSSHHIKVVLFGKKSLCTAQNEELCSNLNFAIQKEPAMLCDQNPEQSKRNHSEDERRGKKKWKEREGEEKEVEVEERLEEEQEKEEKNEEQYPQKRLVSKPLMDTLWATFKLNKCPTKGDSQSLAFEFNMTAKQIKQWFRKRRKKYNKAMYKQKPKKRPKRC